MAISYKVWIKIEEYDDAHGGKDQDLPDCLGTFESLEMARAFHCAVLEQYAPEMLPTSVVFEELLKPKTTT